MSKIRIPVVSIYVQPNGSRRNLDCDITITDDHLRQIRDGIAALPPTDKPAQPTTPWCGVVVRSDYTCNGSPTGCEGDRMGGCSYHKTGKCAQTDADEATRSLHEAIEKSSPCSPWNAARAVFAAIRRGEVPGIRDIGSEDFAQRMEQAHAWEKVFKTCCDNKMDYKKQGKGMDLVCDFIAALRARVAELEAFTNRQETAYASVCMERDAARAKEDALRAEVAALKARKVTWTPETCRQVIERATSLVEFIERRDGPDGGVTMPVHDVVILRDLARAAGAEVEG